VYEFSFWAFGGAQGFNWQSWKKDGGWYNFFITKVPDLADAGITHVWLPPPSHSHGMPVPNSSEYTSIISIEFLICL
jgi:glycosidase